MSIRIFNGALAASALLTLLACGDDTSGTGGGTTTTSTTGSGATGTTGSGTGSTTGSTTTGSSTGSSMGTGGEGGGTSNLADPNLPGPYSFTTLDGTADVAETDHSFGVKAFYPTSGPSSGPYPLVVIGHGFQLPASQYEGYAERLATFGYVAVTADFPAGFIGNSHVDNANDMIGVIDWAAADPTLASLVDTGLVGMTGHSLGGKVSLLAATYDSRIKAVLALDPVDGAMGCSPEDCPDTSELMPELNIPTGILGETLDSTGFQACAPALDNFQTFYAGATSPSFQVDVLGASHMSFLDDLASCGFTCSFCATPTLANSVVTALAYSYEAAFFERHLRQIAGYDAYLTGDQATARYVQTGIATIQSK